MNPMLAGKLGSTLDSALTRVRNGDTAAGRELLRQIVTAEPANTNAWVWLAYVSNSDQEKRAALYRAHNLTPQDKRIHEALMRLMTPEHVARAARNGVYISYARSDELFALDLSENLRAIGVRVWLDMTDMPGDADWHRAVHAALNRCGVMLALLSPAALESTEVGTEQEQFLQQGKIIIPVLHEPCNVPAFNLPHPFVDFRYDFAYGVNELIKLLVEG